MVCPTGNPPIPDGGTSCVKCGTMRAAGSLSSPAIVTSTSSAERRQLTVMFAISLARRRSHRARSRGSARGFRSSTSVRGRECRPFRGLVANYMGDGVLVYFGIRRRTRTTPSGPFMRAWRWSERSLIAPGPRRSPRRSGSESPPARRRRRPPHRPEVQEHNVLGDTPNLAARLQALAGANPL